MNPDVGQMLQKGMAFHTAGNYGDAEIMYRKVLEIVPEQPDAIHFIGVLAFNVGKYDIAVDYISKAIEYMPANAACYNNMGNVFQQQGKFGKAIPYYEKTLELKPDHHMAHNNLGVAYIRMGENDKALSHCRKALELSPEYAGAHNNLGECHSNLGNYEKALESYERAIQLEPELVDAHWNKSLSLLVQGDLKNGFAEYKWRWRRPTTVSRQIAPERSWDGRSLSGQSVFVFEEQGAGDVFQFMRYLPLVKERGARVIFEASPALVRLLSSMDSIDKLWVRNPRQDTSDIDRFDYGVPILDLPHIFGTELHTIPNSTPYLEPDHELVKSWSGKVNKKAKINIGIVWAGNPGHHNDFNRSCRLSLFKVLADIDGVNLYSLQKETYQNWTDIEVLSVCAKDFSEDLNDFADTAAAISSLDLIISVDTAVVHLAGAMGKPTWILLPFNPDWRWLLKRQDSPWYPSLTLFRQETPGGWNTVFDKISEKLKEMAG